MPSLTNGSVQLTIGDGLGGGSTNRRTFITPASVITANNWHQIILQITTITDVDIYVDNFLQTTTTSGTASFFGWADTVYLSRNVNVRYAYKLDEFTTYLGLWNADQRLQMYTRESAGLPMI